MAKDLTDKHAQHMEQQKEKVEQQQKDAAEQSGDGAQAAAAAAAGQESKESKEEVEAQIEGELKKEGAAVPVVAGTTGRAKGRGKGGRKVGRGGRGSGGGRGAQPTAGRGSAARLTGGSRVSGRGSRPGRGGGRGRGAVDETSDTAPVPSEPVPEEFSATIISSTGGTDLERPCCAIDDIINIKLHLRSQMHASCNPLESSSQ